MLYTLSEMSDFPGFCKDGDEVEILSTGEKYIKHNGKWVTAVEPPAILIEENHEELPKDPTPGVEEEVAPVVEKPKKAGKTNGSTKKRKEM